MSSQHASGRPHEPARLTIIGIGNPARGDDAAGLLVTRALAARMMGNVDFVENNGDPAELVAILDGATHAVIIDAARSGARPGTIHTFDAADGPLPAGCVRCSTHAFGLRDAVELARSLGRLPRAVRVYAIEGRDFSTGAEISGEVEEAIERAALMISGYAGELRSGGAA